MLNKKSIVNIRTAYNNNNNLLNHPTEQIQLQDNFAKSYIHMQVYKTNSK